MEALIELDKKLQALENKMNNLIQYGIVDEVDYNNATAVVDFRNGAKSPFLPFLQQPNTWAPISKGEQVVVIAPYGYLQQGFIIPQIYPQGKAPDNDEKSFVIDFATGNLQYKNDEIKLQGAKSIILQATDTVYIQGNTKVVLQNEDGGGVVCKNHLCSFTGVAHPQGSTNIKGSL